MIKEIKYSGITTNPSDYECTDGTLSANIGLLHEDGALRPINQPKTLKTLGEKQCMHIHTVNGAKHYITLDEDYIYWIDEDFKSEKTICFIDDETMGRIYQISSIGNTLILLTSLGTYYFLWNNDTNLYQKLGNHLPELSLSFGLSREFIKEEGDSFNIKITTTTTPLQGSDMYYADPKLVTDETMPHVNKFVAEQHRKGKFIYPFFVRYAYRLYDGSLTMHSSPILMMPTTGHIMPIVKCGEKIVTKEGAEGFCDEWSWTKCKVYGMIHDLDFAVIDYEETGLEQWSDIITSVDVFVSQPLYTFDQSGQCEDAVPVGYFSDDINNDYFGFTVSGVNQANHAQIDVLKLAKLAIGEDNFNYMRLPSKKDLETIIRDNSLFYLLDSFPISDIRTSTGRRKIDTSQIDLTSLSARELMNDDYDSHATLIAKYAYVYNSRLQLADLSKIAFRGYDVLSIFPEYSFKKTSNIHIYVEIYYYIKQLGGKDLIVRGTPHGYHTDDRSWRNYLYYPDTNAYKALVYEKTFDEFNERVTNEIICEISLTPHPMLNGAVYFNGFVEFKSGSSIPKPEGFNENIAVPIRNKIYTSEINNPFYFPVLGINTVGAGKIIAISSASKALSAGQFGQFPLYAFTDEGVWALEVSDTGTYSAKQPITRDVCLNKKSILQLDGEVIFATKRGLMLLSGSNTVCITDNILNKSIHTTPLFKEESTFSYLDKLPVFDTDYLTNCVMLYDYINQRIYVSNPKQKYSFVYSLKTKMWGMVATQIKNALNSYPEALAVVDESEDNLIVDFNQEENNDIVYTQLLITRPIKVEQPDNLKTITTIIQRGFFENTAFKKNGEIIEEVSKVRQILYGSRDLKNWRPIWSSNSKHLKGFAGTPYKYFRIVVIATLTKDEYLEGCTIEYDLRQTNMLH